MEKKSEEGMKIEIQTDSVTYTANGERIITATLETNFDLASETGSDIARNAIAGLYGADPDQVALRGVEKAGRNNSRASFGKWNSGWDPSKPQNASLN